MGLLFEPRFNEFVLGETKLIEDLEVGLTLLFPYQGFSAGLALPPPPDADIDDAAVQVQVHQLLLVYYLETDSLLELALVAPSVEIVRTAFLYHGQVLEGRLQNGVLLFVCHILPLLGLAVHNILLEAQLPVNLALLGGVAARLLLLREGGVDLKLRRLLVLLFPPLLGFD